MKYVFALTILAALGCAMIGITVTTWSIAEKWGAASALLGCCVPFAGLAAHGEAL